MSTILLIDDDVHIRKSLKDILELKGYEIFSAKNGSEGLEIAASHQIDIALIDLGLPDYSGIEVLERIKTHNPLIEVIILTGNASISAAIESTNRGAFYFIEKPCDIDRLLLNIRRAIDKQFNYKKILRNSDIQHTINQILQISLEPLGQLELFEQILEIIISNPWLSLEQMGCIHIADNEKERLIFAAQRGFQSKFNELCAEVPYGECFCGKTAQTKEINIVPLIKPIHHARLECSTPYGHCTIPIIKGTQLLGVMSLVLKDGHRETEEEKEFLLAVGNTLAGIIERKKIEKALQQKTDDLTELNMHLKELVEIEVQKQRSQEQLLIQQSKLAEMGEMIGTIAHQWRQPLNNLAIIIQDVKEAFNHDELNETYINKSIHDGMEQIQYMSQTIDDFRNFFKVTKEMTSFSIRNSVENAIKLISPVFQNNNIKLIKEIDIDNNCEIIGFQNEFMQAVINIFTNAKDAILKSIKNGKLGRNDGSVRLKIYNGNRVNILISNNGGCIPPEIKDKIFKPYFTTKEEEKGTGIGLYMAKLIIETHMKGSIAVENTDTGVEFKIILK